MSLSQYWPLVFLAVVLAWELRRNHLKRRAQQVERLVKSRTGIVLSEPEVEKETREGSSALPWYSALKAVPTRGIPDELRAQEDQEYGDNKDEALRSEFLAPTRRPPDNAPLFTELITQRGGLVTTTLPDGIKQCLLIFSSPFRAADYARVQLATSPRPQYLVSSPLELLKLVADLRGVGIESLALDRCPRCPSFTVVSFTSQASANTVLELWATHKSTEIIRANLYFAYALKCARAGGFEVARDVALEAVGHVTPEDPRLHFLLGQLALGLNDKILLREAKAQLTLFRDDDLQQWLDGSVRSGSPEFPDIDRLAAARPDRRSHRGSRAAPPPS